MEKEISAASASDLSSLPRTASPATVLLFVLHLEKTQLPHNMAPSISAPSLSTTGPYFLLDQQNRNIYTTGLKKKNRDANCGGIHRA
jgi:hypothetical protein